MLSIGARVVGEGLALDIVDATHALALHDGLVSIAASAPITDLHVAFEGDALDLRASTPPSRVRLEGDAIQSVRAVRVNGRDRACGMDGTGTIVIDGGDWAEGSPTPLRTSQDSPETLALPT